MRTTSSIESLNARVGRTFPIHGNLFAFMASLKVLEYAKTTDLRNLINAKEPKGQLERRRNKCKASDKRIKYYENLRRTGTISISEYFEAMATGVILELDGMHFIFLYAFKYFNFNVNFNVSIDIRKLLPVTKRNKTSQLDKKSCTIKKKK